MVEAVPVERGTASEEKRGVVVIGVKVSAWYLTIWVWVWVWVSGYWGAREWSEPSP